MKCKFKRNCAFEILQLIITGTHIGKIVKLFECDKRCVVLKANGMSM